MNLYKSSEKSHHSPEFFVVASTLSEAIAHFVKTFDREPAGMEFVTDMVTVDSRSVN